MGQFLTDHDEISNWLRLMSLPLRKCVIHLNGVVDVADDVNISNKKLKVIPVQFGTVLGSFRCTDNFLATLAGCPSQVPGEFACNLNKLTSLVGGPTHAHHNYSCSGNPLTTLEGLPEFIGNGFGCYGTNLKANILSVLLVEKLVWVRGIWNEVDDIINKHLAGDRDIFACQQEMIDAGFEEYAQL